MIYIFSQMQDSPFLPTAKNSGLSINAESNAGAGTPTETVEADQDGDSSDSGGHNFLGVVVGSAIAAWVAVVTVVSVVVGVVWVRRRRKAYPTVPSNRNPDKLPLVTKL